MNSIIMMMIGVSIFVFFIALGEFLWAVRNKQFDDEYKFTTLNDSEEALQDAIKLEERKKQALKEKRQ
mgnify:CR=1 FL=1